MLPPPPRSTLFPYTTLFRSELGRRAREDGERLAELPYEFGEARHECRSSLTSLTGAAHEACGAGAHAFERRRAKDRKSTRLNSSHGYISYAVFCLKKKNIRT